LQSVIVARAAASRRKKRAEYNKRIVFTAQAAVEFDVELQTGFELRNAAIAAKRNNRETMQRRCNFGLGDSP
jgi:hypothetical protein